MPACTHARTHARTHLLLHSLVCTTVPQSIEKEEEEEARTIPAVIKLCQRRRRTKSREREENWPPRSCLTPISFLKSSFSALSRPPFETMQLYFLLLCILSKFCSLHRVTSHPPLLNRHGWVRTDEIAFSFLILPSTSIHVCTYMQKGIYSSSSSYSCPFHFTFLLLVLPIISVKWRRQKLLPMKKFRRKDLL